MNAVLLENAIKYHGKRLSKLISNEKKCVSPVPNDHSVSLNDQDEADLESRSLDIDKSVGDRILNFVATRSAYLFASSSSLTRVEANDEGIVCLNDTDNIAQSLKRKSVGNYVINKKKINIDWLLINDQLFMATLKKNKKNSYAYGGDRHRSH
jgi:hypothetical protein